MGSQSQIWLTNFHFFFQRIQCFGFFCRIYLLDLSWCFWTVVLWTVEKTLESPLDWKEIKPVHPKGNQPWIFIRRTVAKGESPILWPPEVQSSLTGCFPTWCWERQKTGGEEDNRDGWVASPTQRTWVWASSGTAWRAAVRGVAKSRTQLSNWTAATIFQIFLLCLNMLNGAGNDNPFQYSCLEKSMDRGACRAAVHGVTWLSMCSRGWREMGW